MKYIAVVLVGLVFSSCNCNEKPVEQVSMIAEKEQISNLLENWHLSAAEANFESYFDAMSSESVFVGTDAAEVWNIQQFKDFSKPYFDKGNAWSFSAVKRNIYLDSNKIIYIHYFAYNCGEEIAIELKRENFRFHEIDPKLDKYQAAKHQRRPRLTSQLRNDVRP